MSVAIDVGTSTDEEIVTNFKLDDSVECVGYSEKSGDCPNEAKFRIRRACCNFTYVLCEDCMFRTLDYMRKYYGFTIDCKACGKDSIVTDKLLIVERL